jgi:hypothetical protein
MNVRGFEWTLQRIALFGLALGFGSMGCGSSTTPEPDNRPQKPQVLPSEAFVMLPVVEAPGTHTHTVNLTNGGKDDLVFTSIKVEPAGVLSKGNVYPNSLTALSRGAVSVEVKFAPTQSGVTVAKLIAESNAENFPKLELEIVGPASPKPRPKAPDLRLFETTATAVTVGTEKAAYVRFINVGERSFGVVGYKVTSSNGFTLAKGVADPSATDCTKEVCATRLVEANGTTVKDEIKEIAVGAGAFVVVTVTYAGTGGANDTGTCQIDYFDYNDTTVTPEAGKNWRIVEPTDIKSVQVNLKGS